MLIMYSQQPQHYWDPTTTTHRHEPTKPTRVLLGIFSNVGAPRERQLRHVIRNTYLAFDTKLDRPTTEITRPNRVCSIDDYLSFQKSIHASEQNCQLVYAFVFGGNPKGNMANKLVNSSSIIAMDKSLFQNNQHEQDVVYLNIAERKSQSEKVWAWYQYVNHFWKDEFPYIIYTDTRSSILPTLFWQNDLFRQEHLPRQQRVYGGLRMMQTSECQAAGVVVVESNCSTTLQGDFVMRHFVLLSVDLVQYYIATINSSNYYDPADPDITIANMLYSHPLPIQDITLQGIQEYGDSQSKLAAHDFLTRWDTYKDSVTDYDDPHEVQLVQNSPAAATVGLIGTVLPRVLMGLFTTDSAEEAKRRAVIRQTWVKYYETSATTPNRICSLQELINDTTTTTTDSTGIELSDECQMAYIFVVGGNAKGPKELVDSNASYPISVPCHLQHNHDQSEERDVLCLNIQENMKEGKSQTWFHYASTIVLTHHYFDYLGKMDTDTLLFPNRFLEDAIHHLPRFPNNMRVYGGNFQIKPSVPELHVGPTYMGGALYFMSPDLARYITSPHCNRTALKRFNEDKSIGNFVHSHPLPIRRIPLPLNVREHPLKQVEEFQRRWDTFQRHHHHDDNEPAPT